MNPLRTLLPPVATALAATAVEQVTVEEYRLPSGHFAHDV